MTQMPPSRVTRRSLLAGLSLTACAAPQPRSQSGARRVTLSYGAVFNSLDVAHQIGGLAEVILSATQRRLITLEGKTGIPALQAASSFRQVNRKTYAFELADGLEWSDGYGPVTSEDVAFSIARAAHPSSTWRNNWTALQRVELIDERRGVLHLTHPFSPLEQISLAGESGHIVCKRAYERHGEDIGPRAPAACGPYRLATWDSQREAVLSRNPAWRGPAPYFDEIAIRPIRSQLSSEISFAAGDIDAVMLPASSIERPLRRAGARIVDDVALDFAWLGMNLDHPYFKDRRVVRAIQHAINVEDVAYGAFGSGAIEATGLIPPVVSGHRPRRLVPYDPDAARRLLRAASFPEDRRLTLAMSAGTPLVDCAQVIQQQLRAVGFNIDLTPHERGVFLQLGTADGGSRWDSQHLYVRRYLGGADPYDFVQWFTSDQIGKSNLQRFRDAEYDALNQEASTAENGEARWALYRRMQDILELRGGFIFLHHEKRGLLLRERLKIKTRMGAAPILETLSE